MNPKDDKACYKILAEAGVVPKERLDQLLREASDFDLSLSEVVLRAGLIQEQDLLQLYAKNTGASCMTLKSIQVQKDLIDRVPVKFAWYYRFFPVELKNRKLKIAVSRALDVHTLDEIRFGLGYEIEVVYAPQAEIEEVLKQHYGLGAETVEKILAKTPDSQRVPFVSVAEEKEENIEKLAENASVVQLVNQIILDAYKKRASDIHFEPYRGRVRLRYRIDGRLEDEKIPPEMNQFIMPILSRIKIMANLNIVERRLPQDGKARVKTEDQFLNLRVSSLPTPHGESVVVRILPTKMILSLEQLGFESGNLEIFKELLLKPYGIIFVTGPTGSGKSTTLYSALKSINATERKIITLEDPVEYEMDDMTQVQVVPEIGLTFARGLRSMLRHDPDVMMVGEVRDLETADIAIRSSLTGHLIMSTLHTNDAASGITRLLDIGVEPYLVASSVVAFIAQRLVRTICPHCKEEDKKILPEIKQMIAADLSLAPNADLKIFKGRGCDQCGGTGLAGRIAIHEILVVHEEIRQLIFSSAHAEVIKRKAMEMGMLTLRQDGWKKVLRGISTPEEIVKATQVDEIHQEAVHPNSGGGIPERHGASAVLLPPAELKDLIKQDGTLGKSDQKFVERRKYVRIKIQLNVIFRTLEVEEFERIMKDHADEWTGTGESENISAGGIAFQTGETIYPGDIIEMKVDLPDGDKIIECIAKALRVTRLAEPSPTGGFMYQAAVCFLAIHSLDRARIENFCKERSEK